MLIIDILQCKIITCEDKSHARLAEIDENLICNELSPLERSEHCRERDKILKRMGLRAQGRRQPVYRKGDENNSSPPKTTEKIVQEIVSTFFPGLYLKSKEKLKLLSSDSFGDRNNIDNFYELLAAIRN